MDKEELRVINDLNECIKSTSIDENDLKRVIKTIDLDDFTGDTIRIDVNRCMLHVNKDSLLNFLNKELSKTRSKLSELKIEFKNK